MLNNFQTTYLVDFVGIVSIFTVEDNLQYLQVLTKVLYWQMSTPYKYSHGQELFYKFVSKITNKLVKQLLSMTVCMQVIDIYLF